MSDVCLGGDFQSGTGTGTPNGKNVVLQAAFFFSSASRFSWVAIPRYSPGGMARHSAAGVGFSGCTAFGVVSVWDRLRLIRGELGSFEINAHRIPNLGAVGSNPAGDATTLGANRSPPVRQPGKPQVSCEFARHTRGSASATNARISLRRANSLRDLGLWGFWAQAPTH